MMHQNGSVSRRAAVTGFGALGLGILGFGQVTADDKRCLKEKSVEAHIYPYQLDSGDKLSDGGKKKFEIKERTLLIWVDLLCGSKFPHSTEYVLISRSGTRVEQAEWWPVLNGSPLFDARNNPAIVSPVVILGGKAVSLIEVHIYPYELKPGDTLSDAAQKKFEIKEQTLLIWVKLLSRDEYVVISKSGTRIETAEGQPVLNGNTLFRVFFPHGNPAVVSPVVLARTSPGGSRSRTTDR
jgi:hypothetical protein